MRECHIQVREHGLATVCEEARCPNIGECWGGNLMHYCRLVHPPMITFIVEKNPKYFVLSEPQSYFLIVIHVRFSARER